MEKKRHVSKLQSVFDLSNCRAPSLPDGALGRVIFVYDEKQNLKKFTVLTRGMPEEVRSRITSWLEENIDVSNDVWGSDLNDADLFV